MTDTAGTLEINAPQSSGMTVVSQAGGETPSQNQSLTIQLGHDAKKALLWVIPTLTTLAVFSGLAVGVSIIGFTSLRTQIDRDHEYQMAQLKRSEDAASWLKIQVQSQNSIMQREGMFRPGDEIDGPEGNMQFVPGPHGARPVFKPRSK